MSLATDYQALTTGVAELRGRLHAQEEVVTGLAEQMAQSDAEIQVLVLAGATLDQLVQAVSAESLVQIESLVTYGLRAVFDDLPLSFHFEVSTKRGQQWLEPRLRYGNVDANILDAFGGGPACVVSFLLRLLVSRRAKLAPLILLDETFAFVSQAYQARVGFLLKELADKFGFVFLLVTHQVEVAEAADHTYVIRETAHGAVFEEQ